jgi:hypothetical protein
MQDADQIDDRVLAARQAIEHAMLIDVRLDDVDRRQQDQVLGALAVPRRNGDPHAAPDKGGDEVPPDKA